MHGIRRWQHKGTDGALRGEKRGELDERGAPGEGGKDQDGYCLNEVDDEKRHDESRGNCNERKRGKQMISQ